MRRKRSFKQAQGHKPDEYDKKNYKYNSERASILEPMGFESAL